MLAPNPSQNHKLNGLDHLRALAITMVLLFHYRLFEHPAGFEDWVDFGWTGVDLFFVLSGYLIAGQLFAKINQGKGIAVKEFYFKRFFRIIPVYVVVLAIYFLVPPFREWEALPPLWKYLTFTQNFGLDRQTGGTFSHAWSLCIEEQFYLLLPIIISVAIYFKAGKKAFYLLPILFIAGFVIRISIWNSIIAPVEGTEAFRNTWTKWMYYPTFNRLDGLLCGVTVAAIFEFLPNIKNRLIKHGNLLLMLGLALIIAAYFVCKEFASYQTSIFGFPLVAIAFGVIVTGAVSPSSMLYKHSSRITSFIAALSYAIYLSHKGIIHLTQEHFVKLGVEVDSGLMVLLSLVNCVLAAWILHVLIEKPFLKWRDMILAKKKAVHH
jgi:peptidoglycan/LPS O-acetylase OafA/YrhL